MSNLQLNAQIVSIIQNNTKPQAIRALIQWLPKQSSKNLKITQDTTLFLLESEHDWANIIKLICVWKRDDWGRQFLKRMAKRVKEPDRPYESLIDQIQRLAEIYWLVHSPKKEIPTYQGLIDRLKAEKRVKTLKEDHSKAESKGKQSDIKDQKEEEKKQQNVEKSQSENRQLQTIQQTGSEVSQDTKSSFAHHYEQEEVKQTHGTGRNSIFALIKHLPKSKAIVNNIDQSSQSRQSVSNRKYKNEEYPYTESYKKLTVSPQKSLLDKKQIRIKSTQSANKSISKDEFSFSAIKERQQDFSFQEEQQSEYMKKKEQLNSAKKENWVENVTEWEKIKQESQKSQMSRVKLEIWELFSAQEKTLIDNSITLAQSTIGKHKISAIDALISAL